MKLKFPKPIDKNSKIGLICPAGGFDDYKPIETAIKYLKNKGYKVKTGKSLINKSNQYKYLSGSDNDRLKDLMDFWLDESIDAIFCLRGGYGSLRLLEMIDFNVLKNKKRIFVGFSDVTVLLLAIYAKCGVTTFHGPMLSYRFIKKSLQPYNKTSERFFWRMLNDYRYFYEYKFKKNTIIINPGIAQGPLIGGNLTNVCSLLGSKYMPDLKGAILFLEDCNEEPYKIDRFLAQLKNNCVFEMVNGIIFSSFYHCKFRSVNETVQLLKDKVKDITSPVIYNFPIGHSSQNYIIPIGVQSCLDTSKRILKAVL